VNKVTNKIVLASSGILTSSKNINSEKWTYLKASLEEAKKIQLLRQDSKPLTMMHIISCSKNDDIDSLNKL
jgi:hypothetical protein